MLQFLDQRNHNTIQFTDIVTLSSMPSQCIDFINQKNRRMLRAIIEKSAQIDSRLAKERSDQSGFLFNRGPVSQRDRSKERL